MKIISNKSNGYPIILPSKIKITSNGKIKIELEATGHFGSQILPMF